MKQLSILAVALGVSFAANSASAAVVFSDGFNRSTSTTVGNGWDELQNNSNDVAVVSGNLRLRDSIGGLPDAAAASKTIDATGFEHLEIKLRWRAFGPNEASDRFFVSWANDPRPSLSNEGAWNTVLNSNYTGTSYRTDTISISPGADNSMFNIMLWTNVSDNSSGNHEGFAIDWIKVQGKEVAPVPLPASGLMLLAGAGGLAAMRKRKSHKTA